MVPRDPRAARPRRDSGGRLTLPAVSLSRISPPRGGEHLHEVACSRRAHIPATLYRWPGKPVVWFT
ncbi:hypothetical protein BRC60_08955 [Halobacteriales archaeon QH_1_68_42]|nr:MAG: hypothetical protein BRC60_08955 [Halobacteriales archaeon QH_1_68_42]